MPWEGTSSGASRSIWFSEAAIARLQAQIKQRTEQGELRWKQMAEFNIGSCGHGFSQSGARIHKALESLRGHGISMNQNFGQYSQVIGAHWRQIADEDGQSAAEVTRAGDDISGGAL